uniref:Putative MADS-domain protein n=1 Tax=Cryptomeria japonica TaxID=3369 RepID=Q75VL4_CRYJA|nr:putative MADS-domain protein [Cryptomeria japonica]
MVRGKVNLQRIQNPVNRRVTFSKRKAGLLKKAGELSVLCEAEICSIIFSPTGKLFEFASHSMNRIIGKYKKNCASIGHHIQLQEHLETLRMELENLRIETTHLEKTCKHMNGEDLDFLNFKELQKLEKKMSLSARKIHLRKDKILVENVGSLKSKEKLLELENAEMDKKIGRSHKACHLNINMMDEVNSKLETEASTRQDCLKLTLISRNFHDDNFC